MYLECQNKGNNFLLQFRFNDRDAKWISGKKLPI